MQARPFVIAASARQPSTVRVYHHLVDVLMEQRREVSAPRVIARKWDRPAESQRNGCLARYSACMPQCMHPVGRF